MMTEFFLHFVWLKKLFDATSLLTISGEPVEIIHPGFYNKDQGPDFLNARIKIGDTLWAGNVEIHIHSSDWYAHKHERDPNYQNLILHVVYQNDRPMLDCPMVALKGRIPNEIVDKYHNLLYTKKEVPCSELIHQVPEAYFKIWLERLFVERMESKAKELLYEFPYGKFHLKQIFLKLLFQAFGLNKNNTGFSALFRSISFNAIENSKRDPQMLLALLLGQAGLLKETETDLTKSYDFLKRKYELKSIDEKLWKFYQMRPSNFPDVRIRQLACLLHHIPEPDELSLKYQSLGELRDTMLKILAEQQAGLCKDIYRVRKKSLELILLNCIPLFRYVYAKVRGEKELGKICELFRNEGPESNHITRLWQEMGFQPSNALESQALLNLTANYCNSRRCLDCAIGNKLLLS